MDPTIPMPWYKTWWATLGFIMLGVIAVIAIIIGILTFRVWRQIKNGEISSSQIQSYGQFSVAQNSTAQPQVLDVSLLNRPDAPFLGTPNPKVTVVEFLDFKCPNCLTAKPIMDQVVQKYSNKVKLVLRNFPVESTHPGATQLSEIAWCAKQQNGFFGIYNWLYAHQEALPEKMVNSDIGKLASENNLNFESLQTCLKGSEASIAINRDYADGVKLGVRGTPTFYINGEKREGVIPFEVWDTYLKNIK